MDHDKNLACVIIPCLDAFIERMHRNKPNITYLLDAFIWLIIHLRHTLLWYRIEHSGGKGFWHGTFQFKCCHWGFSNTPLSVWAWHEKYFVLVVENVASDLWKVIPGMKTGQTFPTRVAAYLISISLPYFSLSCTSPLKMFGCLSMNTRN